jgi:tetratricopeptide (TPR) repeat protein
MDHPHIAQVLDGGATETGRPYFVMELVQGVPITEFCKANNLSVEERLKLFIPVCHAIQSAHQKGIIHRDLKPSNVLVTMHNGAPHPMVIDFGVAKATGQKLTEKTLFTNFATMIGTPAYMSPEQAEMSKLDVDTRSDIYSLGVLLYELLTGTPPFPEERLRSVAYAEMQRIIAHEEPERPSTRARKKAASGSPGQFASRHSSLGTDLDSIVMKCLEKDRNRRYETANDFVGDLQRYLANEPVVACPPSTLYRFRKAIRRNKLPFAAGLAVTVALLGGIATTSWQAARAKAAEKMATAEAETSRAVKRFLTDQLFSSNPYETPASNHASRRILLNEMAQAIEGKFADQPLVEEEIREALAKGLVGFGELEKVIHQAERLLELRRRRFPPGHSAILEDMGYLAMNYMHAGRRDKCEQLLTEIEPFLPANGELSTGQAVGLLARAVLRHNQGRPAEGLPDIERAIPVFRRAYGPTEHRVIHIVWSQALMTHDAGRTNEAEKLWIEGLQHFEKLLPPDHPGVARFLLGHAYTLAETKRPHLAIPLLERAISIFRRFFPEGNSHLLDTEDNLARAFELTGEVDRASEIYSRTYPHWIRLLPIGASLGHCEGIAAFFIRHRKYEDARRVYEALRASREASPVKTIPQFESLLKATAAARGWPAAAEVCRRNFEAFPESLWIWLNKAWIFRYAADEESYHEVVKRVLSLPAALSTNEQHLPIEIAALGEFPLTRPQIERLDAMMAQLDDALRKREVNLQASWNYRAMAHLQLRLGRLDECLATLKKSADSQPTPVPFNLFIKALCLQRLGRPKEARSAFEEAEGLIRPELEESAGNDGFLPAWQIYQHLLMHRETRTALGLKK